MAQLYTVDRNGGELHRVTELEAPAGGAFLPTRDEVVVTAASDGNERTQVWLVRSDGSDLRPLLHDPERSHRIGGVTRDGELLAYATEGDGDDVDVHVVSLTTRESHLLFSPGGTCVARGFSRDGRWLAVGRLTERNADNQLFLVDVRSGAASEIAPHASEPGLVGAPAWDADGGGFFFATDLGRDRAAIARYDVASASWRVVLGRDDADLACTMCWPGDRLLVTATVHGRTDARLIDPRTLEERSAIALPSPGVADFGFSRDGRFLAFELRTASEPGDAWLHDLERGRTTRLTCSPRDVDAASMVEPTVETIRSFDGESVTMFVYRPANSSPAPVVVLLHGGPEAQHQPTFDPVVQYMVAGGFAVIAPDVRGSTGYGKRFEHLDDGRRRLDVIADLQAVHRWIVATPGLDERRAALVGGSYGGYLALAGLAFQPERWAAGVSVVGMSSLVTFLEGTAAWRRPLREAEYGSLAADRDFLVGASPLTHAHRIAAPLLLVHGANDPRVPLGEAQQVHDAVRRNGVRSELIVYEDEGHGLVKQRNRLDAWPKVLTFLSDVLS
jgi:dipeptidyl aminopeptidase/acylaminoacyl peptidase